MLRLACTILVSVSWLLLSSAQSTPPKAYKHPLTDLPQGGDVSVVNYFPDHPSKQFPAGSKIKVVAGVHNDATETYNMTAIMGSINSPHDYRVYIQNFTQMLYFDALAPGQEVSLEYVFRPDPALPARDYILSLVLFYEDTNNNFLSTTFFNTTVDIKEVERIVDTDLLFLYITMTGIVGAAGYFAYTYVANTGVLKRIKTKPRSKAETSKADEKDEWLKGTNFDPALKQKQAAAAAAKKTPTKQS